MKLVEQDVNKIEGLRFYVRSENRRILEEFADRGFACARVDDYTQCNARCCASSLNASIKRFKIGNIKAMVRKNKVFLIRLDD